MKEYAPTDLERFPEFHRPLPVDNEWDKNSRIQARAHLGVLDYHRGDYDLAAYARSPWHMITKQFRNMLMRTTIFNFAVSGDQTFTATDDGGNSRTLQTATTESPPGDFNSFNVGITSPFHAFKYGTSSATESETHHNIQSQIGNLFSETLITYDDSNKRVTIKGNETYTGSNSTIREVAHFVEWEDQTTNTEYWFMADRTVVTATAVNTDQIVSVTYEWQF